ITIKRARTWHYRKMRPCIEQSNDLAPLSPFPSWLDCITNTSGYDFRKGHLHDCSCWRCCLLLTFSRASRARLGACGECPLMTQANMASVSSRWLPDEPKIETEQEEDEMDDRSAAADLRCFDKTCPQ